MSDVVENGGDGRSWPVQPGESHEEFFELSALSTTGLLSARERLRLEGHLRHCTECRQVYAQYQAIVDAGVPSAIVGGEDRPPRRPVPAWSVEEAEAKLLARFDREEEQAAQTGVNSYLMADPASDTPRSTRFARRQPVDTLRRHLWWQHSAAVVLVLALGVSLYRTWIGRAEKIRASAPTAQAAAVSVLGKFNESKANAPADASPAQARAEAAEVFALRAQLENKTKKVAQLEDEKAHFEERILATQNERDRLARNADQLGRRLEVGEADLAAVRQQLAATQNQDSQDTARLAGLEQQIEDLKSNAGRMDQEIAREQELLEHDRDIRELMGSRNLYIAEVYDVGKNGQTQRPFGRVFYTKGKSLIFYAYDLDQQPGIREASSFQAWGRKGRDTPHAVNLGIFYADSGANRRWVLKSDDPRILADVDAVFVTVEPQGGSNHPSSKPLLFAYLRIEPNHP